MTVMSFWRSFCWSFSVLKLVVALSTLTASKYASGFAGVDAAPLEVDDVDAAELDVSFDGVCVPDMDAPGVWSVVHAG